MRTVYFYSAALALCLASCSGEQKPAETTKAEASEPGGCSIAKAQWLIGKWQNATPDGMAGEAWEKKDDSSFTGRSFFVKGKDTLSSEALRLSCINDTLFYIPTVSNQNNGQPVKFWLREITDNSLVFENPQHDFPQQISYRLVTPDSLMAEISGTMKGEQHSEKFPMSRVK
jgi:hypothetical protein